MPTGTQDDSAQQLSARRHLEV